MEYHDCLMCIRIKRNMDMFSASKGFTKIKVTTHFPKWICDLEPHCFNHLKSIIYSNENTNAVVSRSMNDNTQTITNLSILSKQRASTLFPMQEKQLHDGLIHNTYHYLISNELTGSNE